MQISYAVHSAVFQSWESSDRSTLIVMQMATSLQIQHLAPRYTGEEATIIDLSPAEAADVADRILLVLGGQQVENASLTDGGSKPGLVIAYTNDGEPFREGVSLAIDTGNWQKDFSFSMSRSTARELAGVLQRARAS